MRGLIAAILACSLGSCDPPKAHEPGVMVVVQETQAAWVRNFNPLAPSGGDRWPTRAGVYEPLMIYNRATSEWTPWLATAFRWSEDNRTLTYTIRQGVAWSDGQVFDAEDVAFTFSLLQRFPALDTGAVWTHISEVRATGPREVAFQFRAPYSPAVEHIGHQPIVPEHIWSQVDDPVVWSNPEPVGTGPFTEIRAFRSQVWELGRNPTYWQEGRPFIDALRFPAINGNDQANLALVQGEVDWAGNFVPAVDRTYVSRNPEHHRYWFPLLNGTVFLYPNAKNAHLADVRVRRAVSQAIDRELLVKVAMYDYTRPSDATGMSDLYEGWRDAEVASASWVDQDLSEAAKLLDAAGLKKGPDGIRRTASGEPISLELTVIAGWSDWVRAAQVITRSLSRVGLDVRLRSLDFSAWYDRATRGEFDLTIGWSDEGPTPYGLFSGLMSARAAKPIGETSATNWHRYASVEADGLLDAFAKTTDAGRQRAIVGSLQRLFSEEVPAIPLFSSPSWAEYNTERFVDFPSPDDPYASPSPNSHPDPLLLLTRVRPRPAEAKP